MKTTAIILAAGMGNRLLEQTTHKPKALVEVGNRPLVSYAIEYVKEIGVEDVIVVGGYCYSDLATVVATYDKNITCVENTEFTLQNLVSFDVALSAVENNTNILVVNIDYIFHKQSLLNMRSFPTQDFSIYCSYDLSGDSDDVMKVQVDRKKNMIHMSKKLTDFSAIYTGYWSVPSAQVGEVRHITKELLEISDPQSTPVEEIFNVLVQRGVCITVADIGPSNWMEVDTPEDLAYAEAHITDYHS